MSWLFMRDLGVISFSIDKDVATLLIVTFLKISTVRRKKRKPR